MKNIAIKLSMGLLLLSFAGCQNSAQKEQEQERAQAESVAPVPSLIADGDYVSSSSRSSMKWHATKIGGEHNGSVTISSGQAKVEKGMISSGAFEIAMQEIQDEDLEGDMKLKLEAHLKSADFFDTEKYPTSTLTIKSVERKNSDTWHITADLQIKDKTNPIEFDARVKAVDAGSFQTDANFSIDRTLWGIQYASKSIFADIGNKAIGDDIDFTLSVVFEKK